MEPRFWQDDPLDQPDLVALFDPSRELPAGVELFVDRTPGDLRLGAWLSTGACVLVGGGALWLGLGIPEVLAEPDPLGKVVYPSIVLGLAVWCVGLLRGARRRFVEARNVEAGRRRYGAFLLPDALVLRLSNRWTEYSIVARIPWPLVEPPQIRLRRTISDGKLPELFLRYRQTPGAPPREVRLGFFRSAHRFVGAAAARISSAAPPA